MFMAHDIGAARSAGDDFWYGPVPTATATGARVTTDSAMRLSTVYKCVRVRAETLGMLPLMVYRRLQRGKDRAADHPLASLLHDQPNPWQTAMQWRQMKQSHLDLRGNAYSQIVFNGAGRVDMLVPLNPDRMRVEVLPSGMPRYHYRGADNRERVLVFGEVLHVAGLSTDGYVGLSPIEVEREAIGAAIATRDYGGRFFANSARPPMWIEAAGKFASAEQRREWINDFAANYGQMNSGRVPIMENGMKLHAVEVSNVDAQFIEQRKYQDVDICGIFRMPPHKVGILDRATWGNIEHQQIDFVTDTMLPQCVAWEQALRRDLDFGDDAFPEFKLQVLLRGDTTARFTAYGKGIQDGWMTRNEARELENMNPLDGLDEPLVPLNMAPAGSKAADRQRGDGASAALSGQRQALIAAAAAERVARKEFAVVRRAVQSGTDPAEAMRGHAEFVAAVMAVGQAAAQRYVDATLERLHAMSEAGTLKTTTESDWLDMQSAALLRLED